MNNSNNNNKAPNMVAVGAVEEDEQPKSTKRLICPGLLLVALFGTNRRRVKREI